MIYHTTSEVETEAVGESIAKRLEESGKRRAVLAMYGEMGVGKTAFTRGFARHFGVAGVKSPTYTIVNEYKGRVRIFHFDTYRVEGDDDLISTGFEDYLCTDGYLLCEWAEKIPDFLPEDAIRVKFSRGADVSERDISVEFPEDET